MFTDRPFDELNLWQRIFAEHWESFVAAHEAEHKRPLPSHWQENVRRMLSCGDIREGYHEYLCEHCHQTRKVSSHLQEPALPALIQSGGRWLAGNGATGSV
jgi:hypothetical protein